MIEFILLFVFLAAIAGVFIYGYYNPVNDYYEPYDKNKENQDD